MKKILSFSFDMVCKSGDTVVITAGVPVGETGATNLMKVHVISE